MSLSPNTCSLGVHSLLIVKTRSYSLEPDSLDPSTKLNPHSTQKDGEGKRPCPDQNERRGEERGINSGEREEGMYQNRQVIPTSASCQEAVSMKEENSPKSNPMTSNTQPGSLLSPRVRPPFSHRSLASTRVFRTHALFRFQLGARV